MANHNSDVAILLERLARVLNNNANTSELKPAQWEALRFFAQANRFSRSPSALTAYLGVTKGTVSQTVKVLERRGLIRKKEDGADRRSIDVILTNEGLRFLQQDPMRKIDVSMEHLTENERDLFASMLESILTVSLSARSGRPFGVCGSCKYFEKNVADGSPHRCRLLGAALSEEDSVLICREHEPLERVSM